MNDTEKINTFFRNYVDPCYKNDMNVIRLSKGNTPQHNLRVCEICCWLLASNIPFYTEVKLKSGVRPDIICPTHIKPIIEVFHTEDEKDFVVHKEPKYPKELRTEIIFNRTYNKFKGVDLL